MKRQWTRGEKLLWLTPLLFVIGAGAAFFGPTLVRRQLERPIVLKTSADNRLQAIALSGDGSTLAATSQRYSLKPNLYFWDARTLQPDATWEGGRAIGSYQNYALSLSPDGNSVVLGPFDNGGSTPLVAYDRQTKSKKWTVTGGFFEATSQFSPDGSLLAATRFALRGVEYVIVRASDGKVISRWTIPSLSQDLARFAWAPDGKMVAAIGATRYSKNKNEAGAQFGQCTLEIRRAHDGKVDYSWPTPIPIPENLAFSPDGRALVTLAMPDITKASAYWQVAVCDIETGRQRWTYQLRDIDYNRNSHYKCSDVAYAPDGKTIAALEPSTRIVLLLDAKSGALKRTLSVGEQVGGESAPDALAWSPDSKRLYARGQSAVLVWDLD